MDKMEDDNTIPKFADFADHGGRLDGEKLKIEEVLGKELIILSFSVRPSRYENDYLTIQFQYETGGEHHVVFTGSTVLSEQLKQYSEKLPFAAAIQKIGKYYSFV
jgi:hypothetical protein